MDRSTVITLIKSTYTKDAYGVSKRSETKRQVMAQVNSVTATEFFEGGRNGLNPEYKFTMFLFDYEGERIVEYCGQRYAVYRTYEARNDNLELYCERQGGTNTPPSSGSAAPPAQNEGD